MKARWLLLAAAPALIALAGCTTESFCFNCDEAPAADAGHDSGPGPDGGADVDLPDSINIGCEGVDTTTDPENCGACDHVCPKPAGALPTCQQGKCGYECAPGFYDRNGDAADGCEYACNGKPDAKELCDEVDNNCDGQVDEGFNKTSDLNNCGGCGKVCQFSNGDAKCVDGACVLDQCKTGFHDNPTTGEQDCDYACDVTNNGAEICDGLDNDCNGKVDDVAADALAADALNCGACGTSCAGTFAGADPKCDGGKCVLGPCQPGRLDKDADPSNGCEYSCEALCSFPFAKPVCAPDGGCTMGDCLPNYYDQNKDPKDGCEYFCVQSNAGVEICDLLDNDCNGAVDDNPDTTADALNCGACGTSCAGKFANTEPKCEASNCVAGPCKPGYLDKDADPSNGCEFNCATLCSFPFAASQCDAAGACSMGECEIGHYDLNKDSKDGCEYACTPAPDGKEVCDGKDNDCDGQTDEDVDTTADPMHCGACFSPCTGTFANADPKCEASKCVLGPCKAGFLDKDGDPKNGCEYSCETLCKFPFAASKCDAAGTCSMGDCLPGYYDQNKDPKDGCEFACDVTNGGVEICDLVDNDCNGLVDDGADTTADALNCGACGASCAGAVPNASAKCVSSKCVLDACADGYFDKDGDPKNGCEYNCEATCSFPFATASCAADGTCTFGQCLPGYYDLNKDSKDGCEYACDVNPPQAELCDGKDNDCNGVVDDAAAIAPQKPAAVLCKPTPGTPCAGADFVCKGTQGWLCNYGPGVETAGGVLLNDELLCDGFDGNCNGQTDEPFGINATCDNNKLGACRDAGVIKCDPADKSKTFCDLSVLPDADPAAPKAEECNGVDDNCNGTVDEGIVDDMVKVTANGKTFFVDRFEVSRPDATASDAGLLESRACVKKGVLPWTQAPFSEAQAACTGRGARLCTDLELQAACEGAAKTAYPYGASYAPLTCNGEDNDGVPGGADDDVLLPTGSLAGCISSTGVYDLSGNAAEWSSTVTGNTGAPLNLPIVITKGGSFNSPAAGLSCQFNLSRASTNTITKSLGFRCCKD